MKKYLFIFSLVLLPLFALAIPDLFTAGPETLAIQPTDLEAREIVVVWDKEKKQQFLVGRVVNVGDQSYKGDDREARIHYFRKRKGSGRFFHMKSEKISNLKSGEAFEIKVLLRRGIRANTLFTLSITGDDINPSNDQVSSRNVFRLPWLNP